ncbi:uncharacterized protein LOC132549190 [Ylistrum balloti]|uniref:uncharacterized protein LOC132549190 n=1 Tax=Ylistrum balloti TaxID=509963 RepID=UPI002905F23A|nr:uncharacterized protein LOC132549190 [Ylistrum balloti]
MKPRQGYALAALCVTLAALCINVLAVALPFWQITAVSTGDVALGLWSTCFLTDGWSECWSHSSVEVWLLIVRTVMMMALVLLVLVVVALCIYLLDISWKEILHAVTVISLLMVVLLIIVGLLIYGLNSPMEYPHVSFYLALIAAILALIAAILLLIGCQCCKCYQRERKQENLHHIQTTDRESRMDTSLVIEREPTQAWPAEDTKMTRRASQFSWNSSAKVQPESAEHTEYIRTASQISRPRSTPVTMFHEEKDDKGCKCCRFCCWFTYCKCCHCEKRERHVETKSTLENTTCTYCSHTRPIGIDKSTSSTSLQQDVIATPNTLLQYESRQQTNIKQINGNNHGNAHHVMMGVNYQSRTPVKNMSTCMTPEHEKGERNRKWNHHKTSLIHCGRVVKAIAFDAHLGPHAPCPFSVYCCRCKHTIQAKTLLNNIRNDHVIAGDTNLCARKTKNNIQKLVTKDKSKDKPANASRSSIENDTKPKGKPKTRETQNDKVEKQAFEKPVTSKDMEQKKPGETYILKAKNNKRNQGFSVTMKTKLKIKRLSQRDQNRKQTPLRMPLHCLEILQNLKLKRNTNGCHQSGKVTSRN